MKHNVFCYGTLKKGFPNHCCLAGAVPCGTLFLDGFEMYSVEGYYPAVIRGTGHIVGEVYEVTDLTLLDRLESNGRLYQRELVTLYNGVEAWIYLYLHPVAELRRIESGVWQRSDSKLS